MQFQNRHPELVYPEFCRRVSGSSQILNQVQNDMVVDVLKRVRSKKMKLKTKKAAAKRFKITKTGKILRGRQMAGHLKAAKSRSARNRYKRIAFVSNPEKKNVARLMPYS